MYTLLNSHENSVSELKSLLNEKLFSQKKLQTKMWDRIAGGSLEKCINTWLKQDENNGELRVILEKYQKSTDDILDLLKEAINELKEVKVEQKEVKVLAIFRNFTTMFLEDVEVRFDKWASVRAAINRKICNDGKVNYRKSEIGIISEFNDFLREVHMTVEDVEAVMDLKQVSNITFHQGKRSETKETEEKLETLLPEGYESYESSLRKVLNALINWDKENEG